MCYNIVALEINQRILDLSSYTLTGCIHRPISYFLVMILSFVGISPVLGQKPKQSSIQVMI